MLCFIYVGMIVVFVPQSTAKCTLYGFLWLYVGRSGRDKKVKKKERKEEEKGVEKAHLS